MTDAIHWQHTRCRIGKIKPKDEPGIVPFTDMCPDGWSILGKLYDDMVSGRVLGVAIAGCYTDRSFFSAYDVHGPAIANLMGSVAVLQDRLLTAVRNHN